MEKNKITKSEKEYYERLSYNWSQDSIRLINTPSKKAKKILFYMQEAGYFKTDDSYFAERANLHSYLIVYTISGEGVLSYNGEQYSLTAGTCFYIDCMELHCYETISSGKWEFLWLHFYGPEAKGYYSEFVKNGFRILNLGDEEIVHDLLWDLIEINKNKTQTVEYRTASLIVRIITELLVRRCNSIEEDTFLSYVSQTIQYIEKHFAEELSLDLLAENVNISKYYLSRIFRQSTGETISEYKINYRINYAKELLKFTECSVEEIAEKCGYEYTSHFIQLFKEREHITPLNYRKLWKI